VNHDEKARGPESTTVVVTTPTLEASLIQATSKIDALVMVVSDQNQKIGKLGQDNADLRNEIRNLSQTFQKSKRDLQMFEITINKITCELRTKFEKMFDKSQSRIQEPIDRLLEELDRMHAPPLHVSGISTFQPNTPFVAEPVAEENGGWGPREDYTPASFNKQHYQEGYEYHGQPVRVAYSILHTKNLFREVSRATTITGAPFAGGAYTYAGSAEAIQGTVPSLQIPSPQRNRPLKKGCLFSPPTLPPPR
jgi:hypothetical protein